MARTLLTTPVLAPLCHHIAVLMARLTGWKIVCQQPNLKKAVFIGAPHTSNWDFLVMLMAILIWRLDMRWIGKHTLFIGPFGPLMRWLGGIPLNRQGSTNFVDQMIEHFNNNERLLLVIAPEGTRAPVERWRSGFYHMAHGAGVPIVLSYIDYRKREAGIELIELPSGDAEQDIARYQRIYAQKTGKHPANYFGYQYHD